RGQVSLILELEEVNAHVWCRDTCGKASKKIMIDSGGSTQLRISLDLSANETRVEGASSGCDVEQKSLTKCKDTAWVQYAIGQSYAVSNVYHDLVKAGRAMSAIGIAGGTVFCAAAILLLAFVTYKIMKVISPRYRKEKQRRNARADEVGAKPEGQLDAFSPDLGNDGYSVT
ncbi:MAG: hypothetical protein ACRDL7_15885, partial [Gaiellaceae bacterium]